MPYLRDKAHGGVLCTFSTKTSATSAGFAISSQLSSSRPGQAVQSVRVGGKDRPSRIKSHLAGSLSSSGPPCWTSPLAFGLGLGTEFRSEKIPRNRLGMVSVIPRKKVLIPPRGIPSSAEEPIPKFGTERNGMEFREKMKFYGTCTASLVTLTASTFYVYSDYFSLSRNDSERNSESLLLFLFHGTEFRVAFSSAEEFGRKFRELASSLVPRNGIPNCFLFR